MTDFGNLDYILGVEKAFSKGDRNTPENSLFETNIFMVNNKALTNIEKCFYVI